MAQRNMSVSVGARTSNPGSEPVVYGAAPDTGAGIQYGSAATPSLTPSPASSSSAPTPVYVNVQNSNTATATAVAYGGGYDCCDPLICEWCLFGSGFFLCWWPWLLGATWLPAWVEGGWARGVAIVNLVLVVLCVLACIVGTVVVVVAGAIAGAAS